MIAILDSIRLDAVEDPLNYFYANEYRLNYLRPIFESNPGVPLLQYRYALEFQNSREIEQSIPLLQELLGVIRDPVSLRMLHESLAISYLRMAEVTNCFENYTPVNCILPFDPDAIHRNRELIRSAIRHLDILLSDYPEMYGYYWMYNIAHIANGTYPDSLNSSFLIPGLQDGEILSNNIDIPRFRDIATGRGVADDRISGSACIEDFNGNGLPDIFTTSYGFGDEVIFYANTGRGTFEDHTERAGLRGMAGGLNIECADFNNSGFPDILILRGAWLAQHGEHPNSLLRNNGDGTFSDITLSSGLFEMMPTQVAAFADVTGNGLLDLFIGNESVSGWQGVFLSDEAKAESAPYPSALFLNNGDETFTRYEALNGFELDDFVKGAVWGDINNNGWPDLYVSVMGGANKLFVHRGLDQNGYPLFEEIAEEAGVDLPLFSFPVAMFDFNNNGYKDLLAITYDVRGIDRVADEVAREWLGLETRTEFSRLFLNQGDETFADVSQEVGLETVTFGMGLNIGDLNNNGYQDIYIGNGAPDLSSVIPNRLLLNEFGAGLTESTASSGVGHLQKGHGISIADLDGNGRLDIYAVMGGAVEGDFYHNALFYNQEELGNWIALELSGNGTDTNRQTIGARVEIVLYEDDQLRSVHRTVSTGGSFGSNHSRIHAGIGKAEAIKEIVIEWPGSNQVQTLSSPDINQIIRIEQE